MDNVRRQETSIEETRQVSVTAKDAIGWKRRLCAWNRRITRNQRPPLEQCSVNEDLLFYFSQALRNTCAV